MEKTAVLEALKKTREGKKRNFNQTIDLIISLRNIDLRKPENQIELFITLPYSKDNKKVCAFVTKELSKEAAVCDKVIELEQFPSYDKKASKKLARSYDFFIAEAAVMPKLALTFGKALASKGKMPNPKAGTIITPTTNIKALCEKLQKTVKISAKTSPVIQCAVGKEDMPDEQIAENILTVYNTLLQHLVDKNAIKSVYLKLTMGKPTKIC